MKIKMLAASVLLCATTAAWADVYELNILKKGKVQQSGLATLVAENTVLTSRGLVVQGDAFQLSDAKGATLVGELLADSKEHDLALIKVAGLEGEVEVFAKELPELGRKVMLKTAGETLEGTVHAALEAGDKQAFPRLQHTALLRDGEFAAPLLNNCGEVIGLSQSPRKSVLDSSLVLSSDFGTVGDLSAALEFLTEQGIEATQASEVCLSVAAQLELAEKEAQTNAEKLEVIEQQREQLEKEKAEAAEKKKELENLSEEQRKAIEEKENELAEKAKALELKEKELKEAQEAKEAEAKAKQEKEEELKKAEQEKAAEKQKQIIIAAALGGLILVLILIAWLMLRKKKSQAASAEGEAREAKQKLSQQEAKLAAAEEELVKSSAEFPDIVIVGTDEDGQEHRIKINGKALVRSEGGQIIGRSAQKADYVINLEQVSREHIRLTVEDGLVFAEDLGSFNGSAINGSALNQAEQKQLKHDDEFRIGTLVCRVHFME
jgi:uncharacterized protein YpmB